MKNPCRIDARNNHAKNMENDANMAPKWRSKFIKKHKKTIQKNITKNDAKIKRQKVIRPEGPRARSEGAHGPGVPEEVRSSSGDSRSRFPLACSIIENRTSGKQLKSNALEALALTRTHLTCRQARCGSMTILGLSPPRQWCAIGSCMGAPALNFRVFERKNHNFEINN